MNGINRVRGILRVDRLLVLSLLLALGVTVVGCTASSETSSSEVVVHLEPGPEAQNSALEAFINAEPGTVIEFGAGHFEFDTTLSLDAANVTVRGAGMNETILDFKAQAAGSGGEGILVTADDFTIQNLGIFNARSDAIKVEGTTGVAFQSVFVNWEGEPKETNGAYGIYPVQVDGVLIEDCKVRGASDAGIYVGQSHNIIVRRNEATENVAGIEIENSVDADVYENHSHGNTAGVLVFSLPELQVKNGRNTRVFNNQILGNNHANFAAAGNIVANVPPGTGVLIQANDNTEVFENVVSDHKTTNLTIVSFDSRFRAYDDPEYDPVPEGIYIHDNEFAKGGYEPTGDAVEPFTAILGNQFPDIVYDGIVHPDHLVDGEVPAEYRIYIENNGEATFANVDLGSAMQGKTPAVVTDLSLYGGSLPNPPQPVSLESVAVPAGSGG